MKKFVLMFALVLQAVCAEPLGRIIDTQSGQSLSPSHLAQMLSQEQIVLIGEEHDNAAHHAAQEWLLRQTAEARAKGSVVLEMLVPEQQQAVGDMQAYLHSGGSTGKRSLAEKINWNMRWDWSQYQSLIYALLEQKAPLLAGSPSRQELSNQSRFMPQGLRSGHPAVRDSLAQLMDAHHGSPQDLVSLQQYKDFKMSTVLLNAPKPAWLIAGNIHVSKQLGVPLFLQDAGFSDGVKTLLLTEEGSEVDMRHADYIWFF